MISFRNLLVGLALVGLSGSVHAASATRTSSFAYNATSGNLTKEVIEPGSSTLCVVTTHGYDAFGNKTDLTTRNCNGSTGEAAAPPLGSDAIILTRTSTTTFDTLGRFPTSASNALDHTETRVFDGRFGALTSITGPNGLTTTSSYDAFGRRTVEIRPDTNKTELTYLYCSGVNGGTAVCPPNGKYLVVTTPKNSGGTVNGAISKMYFDALDREIRSEVEGFNGTLVFKDTEYDSLGRILRTSKPYYNGSAPEWTTVTYDVLGRVLTETQPAAAAGTIRTANTYNGLTITTTLSNNGAATNMPEAVTQTKTTTKNNQGQTVSVADAQGNTVTFTYDPFGNMLTANAGGVVSTMTYDIKGRKLTMADKDMGTWSYAYDVLGQLRRQTNAKLQVSRMSYDELGRMIERTEPDLVSNWTYDWCTKGVGKACETFADNGFYREWQYDSLGRVFNIYTEIDTFYEVGYAYDANGRLSQITYPENINFPPDMIVKNVYNARGYLERVTNNAGTLAYWQANTVSATGKVLTETLGNGATTTRSYDALDRMTGNVVAKAGVNLQNFTYTYDTIGNLTQRVDAVQNNLTENFAFDRLNRLLQASGVGLTTQTFSYNALGNMTSKSGVGTYNYPLPTAAHPHAPDSITGTVNGFVNPTFTYDANGNMLTGLGRTVAYTSYNMPATVSGVRFAGGQSFNYTYTYNTDHDRTKLVHSTLGTFVYLHPEGKGQLLYEKEVKPGGLTEHKNYIKAGDVLVAVLIVRSNATTETRYFHHDHLGSLTLITNSTGGVLERLAYDAFGKRRNANGTSDPNNTLFGINTDRGYTGHEHLDEVALIHMNGRIYDPVVARFMTPDPNLQDPFNMQAHNRYSYVLNNPLMFIDPTGYFSIGKIFRVIVAVAVAIFVPQLAAPLLEAAALTAGASFATAAAVGVIGGGVLGGFAAGLVASGGNFQAGLLGGLTGGLFSFAGTFVPAGIERIAAHAAIGCVTTALGGGSCGQGALSAGVAKFATGALEGVDFLNDFGKGIAVTVVGGTTSVLAGGKFENGAIAAAFGYLFNYCMTSGCTPTESGMPRGRDAYGAGWYGASRDGGGRQHAGWDFIASPGEEISSPIGGTVRRSFFAYRGDQRFTGLEIVGDSGISSKVMYVQPFTGIIGMRVEPGDSIGRAQDLHQKYQPTMTNHVHVEIRQNGSTRNFFDFISTPR
jgi:RHS repeat-associated protein